MVVPAKGRTERISRTSRCAFRWCQLVSNSVPSVPLQETNIDSKGYRMDDRNDETIADRNAQTENDDGPYF